MSHAAAQKLHVRVLSPTELYYDGPAQTVTARNEVGTFDILVGHTNFFSLLTPGHIVVDPGNAPFSIPVTQGIVKVENNNVTFFVDIEPGYAKNQYSSE